MLCSERSRKLPSIKIQNFFSFCKSVYSEGSLDGLVLCPFDCGLLFVLKSGIITIKVIIRFSFASERKTLCIFEICDFP